MAEPIWKPSPQRAAASNMARFSAAVSRRHGLALENPDALWRWSVERPTEFWSSVWDFCEVRALRPAGRVLSDPAPMPGARWFEGAYLNFAENLLRFDGNRPALIALDERGRRREISYHELRRSVAGVAAALTADGVRPGDRVAGFLPNGPEAVIAMLAAASIGAIWSSCSPDFGEAGVLDRFGQIDPKVLFACDGYTYGGKPVDTRARVAAIRAGLPALKRLVVVPFLAAEPDLAPLPGAVRFADYARPGELVFGHQPFDHPLYILYSSGTTGSPKCIVHGAGGTLLQHLKEHVLHTDLRPGDRLFFYTTCGWMMWNWLVSGLASGAAVVLYDGSPMHPGPEALWDIAQRERITHLGVSPKYLAALEKSGFAPRRKHALAALRVLLSTGAPLAPEQYDFVYGQVHGDVHLASISGGTDIVSCFALGHPQLPVYRGEMQARGLGMAVDVFDDAGQPLRGAPGELVCTKPFPSMPLGFWNDPDGVRYRAAYFERFPGVWHHGDYAQLTGHGGVVITGRSDATLNPGGVRIGTSEIYRIVDALPDVLESVAVGHRGGGDERVILFVRLRDGVAWDEALQRRVQDAIRAQLTPRHVPARILPCPEVPRTISGKITELAVRELLHGRPVQNADALANPKALDFFRNLSPDQLL